MRLPGLACVTAATALAWAVGCGGALDAPTTPKKSIGQPAPTAVTSAEPLWLSNDPNRKQSPARTHDER